MRIGSLFSGYGGLDMGVQATLGGRVGWHADNDPAATKLLAHHWPEVPNLGDITGVDWSAVEPVDIVTGGWPCQPWSVAGKRKGTGDERALWPEVARALRVLRPRYIVLENVPGIITAGELARVAGDLATLGYRFAWTCLGAAEIGAPHRRERIFIVAVQDLDAAARERWRGPAPQKTGNGLPMADADRRGRASAAHTNGDPLGHEPVIERRLDDPSITRCDRTAPANSDRQRPSDEREVTRAGPGAVPRASRRATASSAPHWRYRGRPSPQGRRLRGSDAAASGDALADGRQGHSDPTGWGLLGRDAADQTGTNGIDWGAYGIAIRRWERILGRPAPDPTQVGMRSGAQLSPWFVEHMMGLDHGHVCDVPALSRNERLRLLGNGVVPQQAAVAVTRLLDILDRAQAGAIT